MISYKKLNYFNQEKINFIIIKIFLLFYQNYKNQIIFKKFEAKFKLMSV